MAKPLPNRQRAAYAYHAKTPCQYYRTVHSRHCVDYAAFPDTFASSFSVGSTIMDLKAILQSDDNKWSPEAKLLFPENEAFPMVTERWSIAYPPTFAASITAGSIEDVQSAVCPQPIEQHHDHRAIGY